MGQVVAAVFKDHFQPRTTQFLSVVGQPPGLQVLVAGIFSPKKDAVGKQIAHLKLKRIRAARPTMRMVLRTELTSMKFQVYL